MNLYYRRVSRLNLPVFAQFATAKKSGGAVKSNRRKKEVDNDQAMLESMSKFIDSAELSKKHKPDWTDDEAAENFAIGREYQRQGMMRHNKENKDMATKVWLMHEAVRAMPPDLAELARVIDENPPPSDRPWPVYMTPPIKGFNLNDYEGTASDGTEDILSLN